MKGLGIGIAIVGALVAGYALVIFDPSIPSGTGSGRVNNFGLLQDRQNLLLAGGIACIVGALMALLGKQKPNLEWKSEALTARKDSNLPSAAEEQFKKALEWDDVSTLDQLLSSGSVSVSGKLPTGSSFLQYAVLARSKKAIALLLEKGASANGKEESDPGAVELAARSDDEEIKALFAKRSVPKLIVQSTPTPAPTLMGIASQLERLTTLRNSGALTEEEFAAAKARVLRAQ